MTTVDFTEFGFPGVALPLEVEMAGRSVGEGPLVILLAEHHLDTLGIERAVRTALRLADASVVDFVGVEGSVGGVAAAFLRRLTDRGEAIEDYSRDVLASHGGDDGVIAAMAAQPGFEFARTIHVLRPHLAVASVEDPALAVEAEQAHAQLVGQQTAAGEPDQRNAAAREFRSLPVNRQREAAFVKNLRMSRQAAGGTRAALLNAGGYHQAMIFEQLVKQGISALHLRPDGYADALT